MRIPNQLDDDNLYRNRGRLRNRRVSVAPWRRVIRLSLGLALLLIIMRQAAKTEFYAIFFPTPLAPVKLVSPERAPQTLASHPAEDAPLDDPNVSSFTESQRQQVIDEVATADTPNRLRWMGETLGRSQATKPNSADEESWLGNSVVANALRSNDGRRQLAIAIQRTLVKQAKDGTVWRAADGPGLYAGLALHRSSWFEDGRRGEDQRETVVAGVVPLLQQPDVYRGRTVLAEGDLVRIERVPLVDERAASLGLATQFQLWLRPVDGTDRPWLTIVADLPEGLDDALGAVSDDEQRTLDLPPPLPKVRVRGTYLKRLSYASPSGVQLTPVIVGRVAAIQANGNPLVRPPTAVASESAENTTKPSTFPLGWLLLGTTIAGVLLAATLFHWSIRHQRQARSRRHQRRVSF